MDPVLLSTLVDAPEPVRKGAHISIQPSTERVGIAQRW